MAHHHDRSVTLLFSSPKHIKPHAYGVPSALACAALSPDAEETCVGLDNDCDGDIDWGLNVLLHYSTLADAIDADDDGDTICVGAGTEVETLILQKDVRLVG